MDDKETAADFEAIAKALQGIQVNDLTKAENKIATILMTRGLLMRNTNDCLILDLSTKT